MKRILLFLIVAVSVGANAQVIDVGDLVQKIGNISSSVRFAEDARELYQLLERLKCQKDMYREYSYQYEAVLNGNCFVKTEIFVMDYRLSFSERLLIAVMDQIVTDGETGATLKIDSIRELSAMIQLLLKDVAEMNMRMQQELLQNMMDKMRGDAQKEVQEASFINPFSN